MMCRCDDVAHPMWFVDACWPAVAFIASVFLPFLSYSTSTGGLWPTL